MNIGNNNFAFNLFSSLNRNSSEGVLPQVVSVKNTLQVTSSNSVIKDEYIPSASSSVIASKKVGVNPTEDTPTISELEKILVDFLKKNSTLSYNQMVLEIDGNGKFVASDHTVFSINDNSEGNAELSQKYLDELNSIKVRNKSLGEAFLDAYADEFGVDLNAARAEGQEIKSLFFNFTHGIVGDKFVSQSTARTLHIGDAFYSIDDRTQEKGRASESLGNVILGKMQSDSQADTQDSGSNKVESQSKESVPFKLPSLMVAQSVSGPMSDMMKDLNSMLLEGAITRILEAQNVTLKEGDIISMSLNGKGELSILADSSSIWGASGDEISGLCYNLANALNETKTEDGKSLGNALLEQFVQNAGFNLDAANNNEDFSISFSFKYNSETEKNEILDVKQAYSLLFAQLKDEESEDKSSMPFQFDTNNAEESTIDQVLKEHEYNFENGMVDFQ